MEILIYLWSPTHNTCFLLLVNHLLVQVRARKIAKLLSGPESDYATQSTLSPPTSPRGKEIVRNFGFLTWLFFPFTLFCFVVFSSFWEARSILYCLCVSISSLGDASPLLDLTAGTTALIWGQSWITSLQARLNRSIQERKRKSGEMDAG